MQYWLVEQIMLKQLIDVRHMIMMLFLSVNYVITIWIRADDVSIVGEIIYTILCKVLKCLILCWEKFLFIDCDNLIELHVLLSSSSRFYHVHKLILH